MTSTKSQQYFFITIIAIVWGSSFILMKRGLVVYTPWQVGAIRMFSSFIFMLPFVVPHFKKVKRSQWKFLLASGLLGNGIPSLLFPLAGTRISSALSGLLNSLTPIFTLIIGLLWFGMKAGKNRVFGVGIGMLGAMILIYGQTGGEGLSEANAFAFLVVLATISYAFSVNILRYKLSDLDPIRTTGFALFFSGIPLGIYLFSTDFVHRTQTMEGSGFALSCVVGLGLLGTCMSSIIFNRLIKTSGALAASSVTYLIPIVAVAWGFLDHEELGWYHLVGMMAILVGVYLVNKRVLSTKS